jgi:hypothetical protein
MKPLTIRGTGVALGLFLDISFLICVFWGLAVPGRPDTMAKLWEAVLPGFSWLTPWSLVLGLVELFVYGIYTAIVFVPLFNYFEGRRPTEREKPALPGLSREANAHR